MDADDSKGNQTILAVIDAQGCCRALAALGDTAADLFDQVGGDLEDLGFDEDDRPCGTGLHVWQGWVARGCHGDPERGEAAPDNDEWEGEWRPATMEDLARFDFPPPAEVGWSEGPYEINFRFDAAGEPPAVFICSERRGNVIEVLEEPVHHATGEVEWEPGPLATRLVDFLNGDRGPTEEPEDECPPAADESP